MPFQIEKNYTKTFPGKISERQDKDPKSCWKMREG